MKLLTKRADYILIEAAQKSATKRAMEAQGVYKGRIKR
jgi:hypothetical protein